MWGSYYRVVTEEGAHSSPMDRNHNFYIITECDGRDTSHDKYMFMTALEKALEGGIIQDAIIPKSEGERRAIWGIREDFERILETQPTFLYDVSLPIKNMDAYIIEVKERLKNRWSNVKYYVLGHIGDGNLHIFVSPCEEGKNLHEQSDEDVYTPLIQYGGSVSAEHGIGVEKKKWLHLSRSDVEITLMKQLKKSLDPKGILNPGVVFD